jgi:hypothetical protein
LLVGEFCHIEETKLRGTLSRSFEKMRDLVARLRASRL